MTKKTRPTDPVSMPGYVAKVMMAFAACVAALLGGSFYVIV